MDYYISLDVGTTSIKVTLFDSEGNMVALSTREYSLHTPSENIVELDPEVYWNNCEQGIKEVLIISKINPKDIKSIGACTQGETLIVLDKQGKPLRSAIVWMDNRSGKEAEEIKKEFGKINNTGQVDVVPTWPVTKILWLKKNQKAVFEKAYKYLLVEDYIIYRLSGKFKGEYSLYTSSYMLDIVGKKWWQEILDYVGIDNGKLVELCESGEVVGNIENLVAIKLGLSPDTKIVTGAMDQTAAMIGAGNIKSGIVTETTGAALAICGSIDAFPSKRNDIIAVQYHAIPDKYLLIGWCPTGGMALKWVRDTLFSHEKEETLKAGKDIYDYMTSLAEKIPIGSQGLVFLPYLAGGGTLGVSPDTRGVFYGLELHHNKSHIVRALMESIAFILYQNVLEMESMGLSMREIRSLGGGAKSRLWNQIKADVMGRTVTTMKCAESASLGAAILQAYATGRYKSLKEAAGAMVQTAAVIEPDMSANKIYKGIFEKFLSVSRKF